MLNDKRPRPLAINLDFGPPGIQPGATIQAAPRVLFDGPRTRSGSLQAMTELREQFQIWEQQKSQVFSEQYSYDGADTPTENWECSPLDSPPARPRVGARSSSRGLVAEAGERGTPDNGVCNTPSSAGHLTPRSHQCSSSIFKPSGISILPKSVSRSISWENSPNNGEIYPMIMGDMSPCVSQGKVEKPLASTRHHSFGDSDYVGSPPESCMLDVVHECPSSGAVSEDEPMADEPGSGPLLRRTLSRGGLGASPCGIGIDYMRAV